MASHPKSKPEPRQRTLEVGGIVDGERSLVEIAFPLTEKRDGESGRSRVKQPDVKQLVRVVSTAALVVDLNHRFVDSDVIRLDVTGRL